MRALSGWILCLLFALAVAGCSAKDKTACTPWAVQKCACAAGVESTQVCKENGSGWDQCICDKAGAGPDANVTVKQDVQLKPATTDAKPIEFPESEFVLTHGDVKIPAGKPGQLDIVMQGKRQEKGLIPLLVRNNTDKPVHQVTVTGSAKAENGAVISMSYDNFTYPPVVPSGGIAMAFIEFGRGTPADAKFEFLVKAGEQPQRAISFRPLKITGHKGRSQTIADQPRYRIHANVINPYKEPLGHAAPSVRAACFNAAGELTSATGGTGLSLKLAPGGKDVLQIKMDVNDCAAYMLSAKGGFHQRKSIPAPSKPAPRP